MCAFTTGECFHNLERSRDRSLHSTGVPWPRVVVLEWNSVAKRQHVRLVSGARHPKKEVRRALDEATARGWQIETRHGHAWGIARCGQGSKISIFSTPRNAENHANRIRRALERCPHREDD